MENLNNLSDKAWKELANELNALQYQERIKILYDRFDIIRGSEARTIGKKDYVISATPIDTEENLQRWDYYLEQKAQHFCSKWIEVNLKNLDKAPEKRDAIKKHLENIGVMVSQNIEIQRGYDYAITRSGLEWVNTGHISFNCQPTLNLWSRGLGCYYVEVNLRNQQEILPENDLLDLPIIATLTDKQRLVLAHELGIIHHLRSVDWFNHKKRNLSNILCLLFGIDPKSANADKIFEDIKKIDAGDVTRSPINAKNTAVIKNNLSALGLSLKDIENLKK